MLNALLLQAVQTAQASIHAGGSYAVHGVLMVCAYWCFAVLGAAAARYKRVWSPVSVVNIAPAAASTSSSAQSVQEKASDSFEVVVAAAAAAILVSSKVHGFFGKDRWFIAHFLFQVRLSATLLVELLNSRPSQFCLLLLVLASFGVILTQVRAAHPTNWGPGRWGAHQFAGVTVLAATLAQFIVGAARPAPDAGTKRTVWLWCHRGVAALVLSGSQVCYQLPSELL
jgi:hypothetical protein